MDILTVTPKGFDLKLRKPKSREYIGVTLRLKSPDDKTLKQAFYEYQSKQAEGVSQLERDEALIKLTCSAVDGWLFENDAKGEPATLGGDASPKFNKSNMSRLAAIDWVANDIFKTYTNSGNFYEA